MSAILYMIYILLIWLWLFPLQLTKGQHVEVVERLQMKHLVGKISSSWRNGLVLVQNSIFLISASLINNLIDIHEFKKHHYFEEVPCEKTSLYRFCSCENPIVFFVTV